MERKQPRSITLSMTSLGLLPTRLSTRIACNGGREPAGQIESRYPSGGMHGGEVL